MSPKDRNRFDERGFDDRGFSDRGVDRGFEERNLASDRGFSDRGFSDRGFSDRGLSDRGLEQQLTDAGHQARLSAGGERPNPLFAAELRERLVARLETERAPMWPFGLGQRLARVVPVSVAALLFAVAVVGATQLNLGAPDASEPPTAATREPDPTDGPAPTWFPDSSDEADHIVPVVTPPPTAAPTPTPATDPTPPPPPPPPPTSTPPPPGPAALSLSLKPCDGGVVIQWSKYQGVDFNHYTTLRNTVNNIPLAYPPQGGAVDFGGTYATDRFVLSAVDAIGAPGTTYYYRAMAFDVNDQVIAASDIGSAQAGPMLSMGGLGVAPDAGGTQFTWNTYGGPAGCFSYYKIVWSTTNSDPSYLDGDPNVYLVHATTDKTESTTVSPWWPTTGIYYVRIQALRFTDLGAFVAAQSDVTTYVVP